MIYWREKKINLKNPQIPPSIIHSCSFWGKPLDGKWSCGNSPCAGTQHPAALPGHEGGEENCPQHPKGQSHTQHHRVLQHQPSPGTDTSRYLPSPSSSLPNGSGNWLPAHQFSLSEGGGEAALKSFFRELRPGVSLSQPPLYGCALVLLWSLAKIPKLWNGEGNPQQCSRDVRMGMDFPTVEPPEAPAWATHPLWMALGCSMLAPPPTHMVPGSCPHPTAPKKCSELGLIFIPMTRGMTAAAQGGEWEHPDVGTHLWTNHPPKSHTSLPCGIMRRTHMASSSPKMGSTCPPSPARRKEKLAAETPPLVPIA